MRVFPISPVPAPQSVCWLGSAKLHGLARLQQLDQRACVLHDGSRPIFDVCNMKRRRPYAQKYAEDEAAFFSDYAESHVKLSEV